jgi:sec-independent protein translocase protein TatC
MLTEEDKIPFTSHLEELRHRLVVSVAAIGVGFALAYGFKEKLFEILCRPLIQALQSGERLIFTGLTEAFFTYLMVAFIAGLLLAAPVIIYQFWMFIAPGLYKKERRALLPAVILSTFFFVGGSLFGYFLVFPVGFKFLLGFASETIRPLPTMKEYLDFAVKMLLAFGLAFELPIVLTLMARLGIVTADSLKKMRRYSIVLAFFLGAILTPGPDVISQLMMSVPLVVLYELSIIGARIFGRKPEPQPVAQEASADGKI